MSSFGIGGVISAIAATSELLPDVRPLQNRGSPSCPSQITQELHMEQEPRNTLQEFRI